MESWDMGKPNDLPYPAFVVFRYFIRYREVLPLSTLKLIIFNRMPMWKPMLIILNFPCVPGETGLEMGVILTEGLTVLTTRQKIAMSENQFYPHLETGCRKATDIERKTTLLWQTSLSSELETPHFLQRLIRVKHAFKIRVLSANGS